MPETRTSDIATQGLPEFEQIAQREQGLQRSLSARQLTMIAIGGAIGTGLFLGSRFAISFAGPSVLVSYGIGALITLLLMGCMAEMTVAHPTAGSFGAWAEFYLSPMAGFFVRVAYWAGVVLALGTEVTAVAVYMSFWFHSVPGWVWIVSFAAVLVLVNAFNVRWFGAVEYAFSALKVSAICIFLLLGSWVVFRAMHAPALAGAGPPMGWSNYTAFGGFMPKGMSGMWVAVLVSLFSYFSIEMIAIAAGEAKDPQRAITHAFRSTMLRLALFYICTLALIVAIVPWTLIASGAAQSPFVLVMERTGIPAAAGVVNFVILVAALSAMNSQLYITARMLFSLSRAGFAPQGLGRLTADGVPVRALLASTAGIGVAAVVNVRYHERSFLLMLALSMFGPMFTWLMIFVTHLRFRRAYRGARLPFRMWGYPYTSLLGALLMAAALVTTLFTEAFRPTLLYGVPFLLLLSGVYVVRRARAARSETAQARGDDFRMRSLTATTPERNGAAQADALLAWRKEFPILEHTTYMISHSLGPMPRRAEAALQEFTATWASRGIRAWEEGWWEMPLTCGDLIGSIIGAAKGRVAMHQNVSNGQLMVVSCFDWNGTRNKLVTDGLNFPSNEYIYHGLERQGAEICSVESADGMTIPLERILEAIDERTQLVSVSHVAFRSSFLHDLAAITRRAHEVGAYVIADLYQSAGIVPLNVTELSVDFATGGSVKWLLGGPGAGYLYVRPDLDAKLQPAATGWAAHAHPFEFVNGPMEYAPDMHRFLNGTPNVPAMYSARSGYEIVNEIGVEAIRAKSMRQTQMMIALADEAGITVRSPRNPAERGGTVILDVANGREVTAELGRRQILVDYRPGAGVRIAPHFYTADDEVRHTIAELKSIVRG